MRAWMTSTSSSRSSKIASQYSSKAGCHSRCLFGAMGRVYEGGVDPSPAQPVKVGATGVDGVDGAVSASRSLANRSSPRPLAISNPSRASQQSTSG